MRSISFAIRTVRPEDAPELLAIYAPYVRETAITFEYEVPALEEFSERIRRTLERFPYLAAQSGDRLLGYAYASPFQGRPAYGWSAQSSIYVDRSVRRSGVGRALCTALEQTLTAQNFLNLNACIAMPAQDSDPYLTCGSAAFHTAMGYRPAGWFHQCGYKFGRWYDMIWMEKILGPHPDVPAPIIPFPELSV